MAGIVRSPQGRLSLIALRVDGSAVATSAGSAGLLAGSGQVTIAKGSGGTSNEVTITLKRASKQVPVVTASAITTNCHIDIKSVTDSVIVLETFQVADGTTGVDDADMHVQIVVWEDSRDD